MRTVIPRMKRVKKFTALFIASLAIFAFASAQDVNSSENIDTVILASTENYPDALMASAVSQKKGIPILLTERFSLPEESLSALEEYSPSKIVVVGGSSVVSREVQESLEENYTVDRVWGVTRYGTAVQLSDYFWPSGADEAILVENGEDDVRGDVLAQARKLSDGRPVFLTPSGKLPVSVVMQLEDLGVNNVTYVGRPVSDEFREQLEGIGADMETSLTGDSEAEIKERIRERSMDSINRSQPFIVVAATDFRHSLSTVNSPDSNSYVVGNLSDVEGLLETLNDSDIKDVRIVGSPGLGEEIASSIDSELEDMNISLQDFRPSEAGRRVSEDARENRQKFQRMRGRARNREDEDFRNRQENLERRANQSIARAMEAADKYNMTDSFEQRLERARSLFESGDFAESIRESKSVMGSVRMRNWQDISGNMSKVSEEAREEMSDMEEEIDELREMNREFAEEMQENLSTEERLEIIEELRSERREHVREIVEEAGRSNGDLGKRVREARRNRRMEERDEDENESEDMDEDDSEEMSEANESEDESESMESENIEADMECRSGDVEEYLTMDLDDEDLDVEGRVMLDDMGYVPSVTRQVINRTDGVYIRINFDRQEGVMGATCLALSDFETEYELPEGNWTVTSEVFVGEQKVLENTRDLSVVYSSD